MAPTLNLIQTLGNSMVLAARKLPMSQKREDSDYHDHDQQLRSPSTPCNSRFCVSNIVSLPLSPVLPSLVRPRSKEILTSKYRRQLKVAAWLISIFIITYHSLHEAKHFTTVTGWAALRGSKDEAVRGAYRPDFPSPVILNIHGQLKWTISIKPGEAFPLAPRQYAEICNQSIQTAEDVANLHGHLYLPSIIPTKSGNIDPNFIDVREVMELGIFPDSPKKLKPSDEFPLREGVDELTRLPVCNKTMTYLLESSDAGLGSTLMMLWTAYGLAREEGRDFFVDDSRWAYGRYTQMFQPPPKPPCKLPPYYEILPYPAHTRHLVLSAATATYTFEAFSPDLEGLRQKDSLHLQRRIFSLARIGYEALFHLTTQDQAYVDDRVKFFKEDIAILGPENLNATVIGIHVRHGDRRPLESPYKDSYIPLYRYVDKAEDSARSIFHRQSIDIESSDTALNKSIIILASDDPDVYLSEEFEQAFRAQEKVNLASRPASKTASQQPAIHKFVGASVGWEGGFFASMFWNLGKRLSRLPREETEVHEVQHLVSAESLKLRELVARTYLMDSAVLGKASDKIICTVSCMSCRLLGIMMGWEKAIDQRGWVNIDGESGWIGMNW
ncbi:BgTH12-06330 [Blumeria graminis f. sp. triticale]|uniref:BgTH12-06330 n=1 Tax=Blumeria graminis f. sp. triticale TaxID=1689686 RepID=A0A9W4DJ48_BLUGR|nr:BgTH12-06330 [Blumeria graminis f. sp. triticale]